MRVRRGAAVTALVALCASATACADPGVTRAGVAQPQTVLRLGVAEPAGAMPDEIAQIMTAAAAETGLFQIELWRQPDENPQWNQELAHRVMDGELDLAVVAASAWDALDASSLSAMFLPFAVTSDELLDAVAQSDIADDMLAALDPVGVTGLGLVPAGFRHLFSPADQVIAPEDVSGTTVRVTYSTTVWDYYEAVGAVPVDPNGDASDDAVAAGEIDAFDSMFGIADGFLDAPVAAGDVAVHPHAFTIVANSGSFDRLPAEQQSTLRESAAAAVEWSVRERPRDFEAAAALCDRAPGSRVFHAGPATIATLRSAARPVIDAALEDSQIAGFAARIAALDAQLGHPRSEVEACEGPTLAGAGETSPNVPADFPDGEYRREVTEEALLAAGVDAVTAANHVGVWHLIFENGVLVDPNCVGSRYEVIDGRLVVALGVGENCGTAEESVFFSAGWRLERDQLTFTAVESGHGADLLIREAIGGGPWTKIR